MKVSSIALTLLVLVAHDASAASLRKSHDRQLKDAEALLGSGECDDYMDEKLKKIKEEMDKFSPAQIANKICNPVARDELLKQEEKMEEDVDGQMIARSDAGCGGGEVSPCKKAFEVIVLEHKSEIGKTLKSGAACKEEVKKELAAVEEVGRMVPPEKLNEPGMHRHLLFGWLSREVGKVNGAVSGALDKARTDINNAASWLIWM